MRTEAGVMKSKRASGGEAKASDIQNERLLTVDVTANEEEVELQINFNKSPSAS